MAGSRHRPADGWAEEPTPLFAGYLISGLLLTGAFRLAVGLWLTSIATVAVAIQCSVPEPHEYALVDKVIDGDTVHLTDGRKVRLLGINAPELAHDGRGPEPLAQEATYTLKGLLPARKRVGLVLDRQRTDRYGRLLAHLFIDQDHSIAADLLERGLVTTLVLPPNTLLAECYSSIQARARVAERGLWRLAAYRPKRVEALTAADLGYRIVVGKISKAGANQYGTWLTLDNKLWVYIDKTDARYFSWVKGDLSLLKGRHIIIQGRLTQGPKGLKLKLHYPTDTEWPN